MKRLTPLGALLLVSASLFADAPKNWTFQNDSIQAVFGLDNGVFRFVSLSSADGTIRFLPPAGTGVTPIRLEMDGAAIDENTLWTFVKSAQITLADKGIQRTLTFKNDTLALQVAIVLEAHPGQPFLRYWLDVTNLSTLPHVITGVNLMNWQWQTGGKDTRVFTVNQYRTGANFFFDQNNLDLTQQKDGVTVFSGAHGDHIGWIALVGGWEGPGIVAGWEFDGRAHITASQVSGGSPVQLSGGPDNLRITVAPTKTVALPASFLGLYNGDWDEAGYRTQRYVEAVLARPIPDNNFPYVMFDTWAYQQNFNDGTLRTMAARAAAMGVEVFIVDLGWTRSIGDWRANTAKFPSGLKSFSDYVHSLGMKLGLHWTPAEASPISPIMTSHPEYQATEASEYFGALGLCLSNTPGQTWARTALNDIVTSYGVDWITQDGENLVKECTRADHTHDPANSNYDNSVNGIDSLLAYSIAKHPQLLWENNADGGDMLTFQMVKNYVTAASCDACSEILRLQSVYGMSYVFPPRYIDRYVPGSPTKWNMRTAAFGGPLILMQKDSTWTTAQVNLVAGEIQIYKALRGLIRDGKVYHLGPVPGITTNSAIESYNAGMDRAVIFAYRPQSPDASMVIHPRGLSLTGTYTVHFQDSAESWTATGAAIMTSGITVKLPAQNTAEIVYIDAVSLIP